MCCAELGLPCFGLRRLPPLHCLLRCTRRHASGICHPLGITATPQHGRTSSVKLLRFRDPHGHGTLVRYSLWVKQEKGKQYAIKHRGRFGWTKQHAGWGVAFGVFWAAFGVFTVWRMRSALSEKPLFDLLSRRKSSAPRCFSGARSKHTWSRPPDTD